MSSKFSISERLSSFKHAFNGLRVVFREEHNARVHLFAATVSITLGVLLHISFLEWVAVVIVNGFVLSVEFINTSIEHIADFISPEKHESIKRIKDISAAAVLISSLTALITGGFIFLPKIISLLL